MVMCCLLGVCCPPEERVSKLAEFLHSTPASDVKAPSIEQCRALAARLLARFDLAPKGLSDFIRTEYGPAFAEASQ